MGAQGMEDRVSNYRTKAGEAIARARITGDCYDWVVADAAVTDMYQAEGSKGEIVGIGVGTGPHIAYCVRRLLAGVPVMSIRHELTPHG